MLGLVLSRLGLVALAQMVEDKFRYDWADIGLLTDELLLAGMAIFVGLIAAAIPGISAVKMDTSRTLSEAQ